MRERTENLIWSLIILIGILIIHQIIVGSNKYDCSQCVIEFKNKKAMVETTYGHINVTAIDLFSEWFLNDQCMVRFNPDEGYRRSYEGIK